MLPLRCSFALWTPRNTVTVTYTSMPSFRDNVLLPNGRACQNTKKYSVLKYMVSYNRFLEAFKLFYFAFGTALFSRLYGDSRHPRLQVLQCIWRVVIHPDLVQLIFHSRASYVLHKYKLHVQKDLCTSRKMVLFRGIRVIIAMYRSWTSRQEFFIRIDISE